MNYRLTPATQEDEPFLAELFAELRAPEFAPLQLPPPALAQMLAFQARAQRAGYLHQYPNAEDTIVWVDTARAGRILLDATPTELRLIDIALLAPFRGQGIGQRLLTALQTRATNLNLPLRLSVRTTNPAARLYQRLGFLAQGSDGMNAELEWHPQTAAHQPVTPIQPAPPNSQSRLFRSAVGHTVEVIAPHQTLSIESVNPLTLTPGTDPGDSFAVRLRGTTQPPLPQGTYTLRFAGGTTLELFLAPIQSPTGTILYEAIFNRTQPTPRRPY